VCVQCPIWPFSVVPWLHVFLVCCPDIFCIIIIIFFTQGIYTYIPETNYVPREYSVAAILLLLFMVLISLDLVLNLFYFYISTFRIVCAVPNMAVFCSSLTSCFPCMFIIIIIITFIQGIYYYIVKQAMFLEYTVLQLFCMYNRCYM